MTGGPTSGDTKAQAGEAWLILGASSAIARAFARRVAADGAAVILAGRDSADLADSAADLAVRYGIAASGIGFDACDTAAHAGVVQQARERTGAATLNVLLAFAIMPPQKRCEQDFAAARAMIETNYLGAVSILHALAPVLEAQGCGRVIVIGSVSGDRGRIKNYVYGSTKAALSTFCEGLRARLFRSGVSLVTVRPGFVDTAMTWGQPGLFLVATPEALAERCLVLSHRDRDGGYAPRFWGLIMAIIRAIPDPIFKRLGI